MRPVTRKPKKHSHAVISSFEGTQVKDRYKFFGEVALEKKFVTPEQLYKALTIQARAKVESGDEKLLGQILLEQGYMTADQVRQVLDVLYPPSPEAEDRRS